MACGELLIDQGLAGPQLSPGMVFIFLEAYPKHNATWLADCASIWVFDASMVAQVVTYGLNLSCAGVGWRHPAWLPEQGACSMGRAYIQPSFSYHAFSCVFFLRGVASNSGDCCASTECWPQAVDEIFEGRVQVIRTVEAVRAGHASSLLGMNDRFETCCPEVLHKFYMSSILKWRSPPSSQILILYIH